MPSAQHFYITGMVRNPGTFVLDPGMNVQQAIALAGGLNDRGSDRRIKVSRLVNAKLVEVDIELEDKIQPGDTVIYQRPVLLTRSRLQALGPSQSPKPEARSLMSVPPMRVMYLSPTGQLGGAESSLVDILASLRGAEPSWPLHLLAASDGPSSGGCGRSA